VTDAVTKAGQAVLDQVAENGNGEGTQWYAAADANRYRNPDLMLSDKMPTLVKGAGYCKPGGNTPLTDDEQIFKRSMRAETAFRKSIRDGLTDPGKVLKGISPDFGGQFGAFMANSPQNQMWQNTLSQLSSQIGDALGKSITLTSPLNSGFVPYDLVAPSSLIYPVG